MKVYATKGLCETENTAKLGEVAGLVCKKAIRKNKIITVPSGHIKLFRSLE
jgi:hypothetical protein